MSSPPTAASVARNPNYSSLIHSQLYVGDLATASDAALLDTLGITHVVSCGFARPLYCGGKYKYACLDPLQDDPAANLVRYLPRVTGFIEKAVDQGGAVLVHCVYGQSRSCAVCVAFLMRRELRRKLLASRRSGAGGKTALHRPGKFSEEDKGKEGKIIIGVVDIEGGVCDMDLLRQWYNFVESRRVAMAINPGFVRQLELFRRMGCGLVRTSKGAEESNQEGSSNNPIVKRPTMSRPHASFRSFKCCCEYRESGTVARFFPSLAEYASATISKGEGGRLKEMITECYRCFQCQTYLFHRDNVLDGWTKKDETSIPQSEYWSNSAGGRECIARWQHRSKVRSRSSAKGHNTALVGNCGKVIHVEPIKWMREQMLLPSLSAGATELQCNGRLLCPVCGRKIGSWDFLQNETVSSQPYACVSVISSKVEVR
uniref:protein-tyrosine-phosphatase n=2 Tax=Odontella aurita TaxID=265563 RepID=A0A7S4I4S4_9STRA|mmetsp:Transcript_19953/g.57806  ORF Transcript_19953/g.57806 Transcript_19953/m.57806 type:complete len:429 (+) Transcript_19953:137-1423(+)